MKMTGRYITIPAGEEPYKAFLPYPLPPDSTIELDEAIQHLLQNATLAVGRLDGISTILPDISLFLYFYVRKEAVISSQIEGTQSSLSDLLMHEEKMVPGVPIDDVQEVSNYVAAVNHGLKRLREDNFPLSLRLLREMHGVLMAKGRGSEKTPGEFRQTQNWLGGTRPGNARFVPPPPDQVMQCMGDLEKFLHDQHPDPERRDQPLRTPVLIKAALAHVQFETIHPFLDGNGRLGRLMIPMILCAQGVLKQPLLYLSLFFKQHRLEYYDRLDAVRFKGDWQGWLRFFLEGVQQTAEQAADTGKRILALFDQDIATIAGMGRQSSSVRRVYDQLQRHPYTSIPLMTDKLQLSSPTVRKSMALLEKAGIVKEVTGFKRDRIYLYHHYVAILEEGTLPLPR